MMTRREVERIAGETGFRPEAVEKVLRLLGILERIDRHPATKDAWILRGGTALNLFHLDVPRLSVDIDLDYVGEESLEGLTEARPRFESGLRTCCEREECEVRHVPGGHAGGKHRLRYTSLFGGMQNLEVDVNYVSRVPIWGSERLEVRFPPRKTPALPVLRREEIAAGKFAALVGRTAIRDAYDAMRILELDPDLPWKGTFRLPFVCSLASSREDVREIGREGWEVKEADISRELLPLLRCRAEEDTLSAAELAERIRESVRPAREALLEWSGGERKFLDLLLDEGEIRPELLHGDASVQDRIRRQPMLKWKAAHVREFRRRR